MSYRDKLRTGYQTPGGVLVRTRMEVVNVHRAVCPYAPIEYLITPNSVKSNIHQLVLRYLALLDKYAEIVDKYAGTERRCVN